MKREINSEKKKSKNYESRYMKRLRKSGSVQLVTFRKNATGQTVQNEITGKRFARF